MAITATRRLAVAPPLQPFASAWNAWRQITSTQIRYATLLWLVWGLSIGLEALATYPRYAAWEPIATGFYDAFLVACLLLLGVAVADAIPPPARAPRWLPFAMAAVVASVAGAPLIVYTEPLVGLHCCWDEPRPPDWVFVFATLGGSLVISTLAALGYFHRRRALQRVAALRGAQLERAQLARQAFEARLQAMQARVEPQFLFNTLAQVERLYETDAKLADRMLDDLIVYLRAALPQLRETTSTLANEIELVRAYFNIVKASLGDRLLLDVAVPNDGCDVRFPPMVLLPLIEHAIVQHLVPLQTGDSVRIGARIDGARLILTAAVTCARFASRGGGDPAIQGIRERLAALYDAKASLSLERDGHGLRALIEIPYERVDDRDHR